MRSADRRDERGAQLLEFAVWVPVVLFALLTVLQLCSDLYVERQAEQAVRGVQQAVARGDDPDLARRRAATAFGSLGRIDLTDGRVEVFSDPPRIAPWVPNRSRPLTGQLERP